MLAASGVRPLYAQHGRATPEEAARTTRAAHMSEAILNPTLTSDAADGLKADALRAQDWAGEPFLHAGEDPAEVLAPGTARRAALDEALAEIDAGRATPSPRWKVRFGLLLGLERVLSSKPPDDRRGHRAAQAPDRRARRDAHRADRREPALAPRTRTATATARAEAEHEPEELDDEDELEAGDGPRTTTSRRRSSARIRAPSAATASATRPRPARRSPRRASSRRRARSGS